MNYFWKDLLQKKVTEISQLVMRLVRHYDQDERKTDVQKSGGRKFSDTDWLQHL